ncbi:MAG: glycosyltransferase family 2 protein [Cytophagales bacterium]|nr:glycosyltransferase family 2 protein [Cytophagales bacterium]
MPFVSVIVPNYNHAAFLEQRIRSVLEQTFTDYEVILMDDGSRDGSPDLLRRYEGHPRVSKVLLNAQNGGSAFRQWNKGVAEAAGRYVWIAESDDWADPRLLEVLVAAIRQSPRIGVAYCQSWLADEQGRVTGDAEGWYARIDPTHWQADFISSGPEEIRRYLVRKNALLNASGVLFEKRIFLEAGGAPADMYYCGDWITWVRMLLRCDVAFVRQKLNYFRQHAATTRNLDSVPKQMARLAEEYRVVSLVRQCLGGEGPEIERRYDQLLKHWVAWSKFYQYPPAYFFRMLRLAGRHDKRLTARIVKYLFHKSGLLR